MNNKTEKDILLEYADDINHKTLMIYIAKIYFKNIKTSYNVKYEINTSSIDVFLFDSNDLILTYDLKDQTYTVYYKNQIYRRGLLSLKLIKYIYLIIVDEFYNNPYGIELLHDVYKSSEVLKFYNYAINNDFETVMNLDTNTLFQ
jgi:hypothetical protein